MKTKITINIENNKIKYIQNFCIFFFQKLKTKIIKIYIKIKKNVKTF